MYAERDLVVGPIIKYHVDGENDDVKNPGDKRRALPKRSEGLGLPVCQKTNKWHQSGTMAAAGATRLAGFCSMQTTG